MRDRAAVAMAAFTATDPDDRAAFDAWIDARARSARVSRPSSSPRTAASPAPRRLFTVDGDREVSFWIARHAWGRGVATEALRLLVSREAGAPAVRPRRRAQRGLDRGAHQGRVHRGLARHRLRAGCRARGRGDRARAGAGARRQLRSTGTARACAMSPIPGFVVPCARGELSLPPSARPLRGRRSLGGGGPPWSGSQRDPSRTKRRMGPRKPGAHSSFRARGGS